MYTLDQMCGRGRELTVDLGEGPRVYQLAPITLGIMGDLQLWAEGEPLRAAAREIEALGEVCDRKQKDKIISEAREQTAKIRRVRSGLEQDEEKIKEVSKYLASAAESIQGVYYLSYLVLKGNGVTPEEAKEIVDAAGAENVKEQLDEANITPKHPGDKDEYDPFGLSSIGDQSSPSWLKRMVLRLAMWLN